jgi:hypothetical protein
VRLAGRKYLEKEGKKEKKKVKRRAKMSDEITVRIQGGRRKDYGKVKE